MPRVTKTLYVLAHPIHFFFLTFLFLLFPVFLPLFIYFMSFLRCLSFFPACLPPPLHTPPLFILCTCFCLSNGTSLLIRFFRSSLLLFSCSNSFAPSSNVFSFHVIQISLSLFIYLFIFSCSVGASLVLSCYIIIS